MKLNTDERIAKEKRKIHVNGIPKDWKNVDLENYFKKFVYFVFVFELGGNRGGIRLL